MISSNPKKLRAYQTTDSGQVGGAGAALANSTVYQAATDGILIARFTTADTTMYGYCDTFTPPTTAIQRVAAGSDGGFNSRSFTMPVAKGEYWKITGSASLVWRPLK